MCERTVLLKSDVFFFFVPKDASRKRCGWWDDSCVEGGRWFIVIEFATRWMEPCRLSVWAAVINWQIFMVVSGSEARRQVDVSDTSNLPNLTGAGATSGKRSLNRTSPHVNWPFNHRYYSHYGRRRCCLRLIRARLINEGGPALSRRCDIQMRRRHYRCPSGCGHVRGRGGPGDSRPDELGCIVTRRGMPATTVPPCRHTNKTRQPQSNRRKRLSLAPPPLPTST